MLYMISISFFFETWLTTLWFLIHLTSWITFHFCGGKALFSNLDCINSFFYWTTNPWNIIDFCRICLLGSTAVYMIFADVYGKEVVELFLGNDGNISSYNLMCYLQLCTWLSFLDYLNMFGGFRILMRFIFKSF
jgi:hypothetical protein